MERYDLSKENKELLSTLGCAVGTAITTALITYLNSKYKN